MSASKLVRFFVQCTCSFALIAAISSFLIAFEARFLSPAQAQSLTPEFSEISEPGQVYIDFSTLPPDPPGFEVEVPEGGSDEFEEAFAPPPGFDPVVQEGLTGWESFDTTDAHGLLSAPILNFAGMSRNSPDDIVGDVGPNHYVQMINATRFQIWDKQGNSLAGPINFETLWTTAAANMGNPNFQLNCQNSIGDPIVVYDHLADRWLLSQFANPNHMCIAISQTANPVANTWNLYLFNTTNFPDYPKFGVWPDGYYMTAHEGSQGVYVFDRANMLTGNPASFVKFSLGSDTQCPRSSRVLPSDLDGPLPPAGSPNFFIRPQESCQRGLLPGNDQIQIWEFQADWQAGGTPTFTLGNTISEPALASWNLQACNLPQDPGGQTFRACIRQPNGGGVTLDALPGRPMMQLKYRHFGTHESVVTNTTVEVGGNNQPGIRWWELRRTPAGSGNWVIHQQGTYAPNQAGATTTTWLSRWMGSMAMDKDGNIALGYSIVNGDQANPVFPGIRYTGRLASDPLGLLPQGEETIIAGGSTQTLASRRWGDYSAMTVDPADDCTFWYTQHFIGNNNNGLSQIASFNFPGTCGTDLEITKTADTQLVHAGDELFYDITVTNNGDNDATNVSVIDTLPAEVTYLSDTDSCVQGPVGTLTCDLGDISNGDSSTFTVKVRVDSDAVINDPDGSITITNTASVSADQADTDESNNEAEVTTFVEDWADLRITKLCKPDRPLATDDTGTCTILVDNLGTSAARDVELVDTHVSNGAFTITSANTTQGACAIAGGIVTCTLGDIDAGDRVTVTVEITSLEDSDVNDVATVSSATPDPNSANNQAQASLSFVEEADLWMEKHGKFVKDAKKGKKGKKGKKNGKNKNKNKKKKKKGKKNGDDDDKKKSKKVRYILIAHNDQGFGGTGGPSDAENVVVVDRLPLNSNKVEVVEISPACVYDEPTHKVICTQAVLPAGSSVTFEITIRLKKEGRDLINKARVTSTTRDPDLSNNKDVVVLIDKKDDDDDDD